MISGYDHMRFSGSWQVFESLTYFSTRWDGDGDSVVSKVGLCTAPFVIHVLTLCVIKRHRFLGSFSILKLFVFLKTPSFFQITRFRVCMTLDAERWALVEEVPNVIHMLCFLRKTFPVGLFSKTSQILKPRRPVPNCALFKHIVKIISWIKSQNEVEEG